MAVGARAYASFRAARSGSTRPRTGARSRRAAPTFAVLGCGVDVVYPDRHAALFDEIAVAGGLLSEYRAGHAAAGEAVSRAQPIVAALAEAVVVVEAQPGVRRADHRAAGDAAWARRCSRFRAAPAPTS